MSKAKKRTLRNHFVDRLRKLANHLEFGKLAHKTFDFTVFNGVHTYATDLYEGANPELPGCGTAGCALGECPAIFKEWTFRYFSGNWGRTKYFPTLASVGESSVNVSARKFFGLTESEVMHLFYPARQTPNFYGGKVLGDSATREEVATNLRSFLYTLKTNPWDNE